MDIESPPDAQLRLPADSAYLAAALRRAEEEVATAPEGRRNTTLNAAAYGLTRLVPRGLSATDLVEAMVLAANRAGLPLAEITRTVRSALRAGGVA